MAVDFNKICRICLESNKQTLDIYTNFYVKRNTLYCDMLSSCTKLKPSEGDGLPRLICTECCRQLKRTYAFNIQCEESDRNLKILLENAKESGTTLHGLVKSEDLRNETQCDINDESQLSTINDNCNDDNKVYIKSELSLNEAESDIWTVNENDLLEEIKIEKTESLTDIDESCWEADDNILLHRVEEKQSVTENKICTQRIKKKRGRKKKELQKTHHPELDQLSAKEFRRSIYHGILAPVQEKKPKSGTKPSISEPSSPQPVQIKKHKPSVPRELRLESSKHQPERSTSRRCAKCSTKKKPVRTIWQCKTCKVPLCIRTNKTCFSDFHQNYFLL